MSSRALWGLSVPLALLGWAGVLVFTYALSPWAPLAPVGLLPLLALAVTMTAAPITWLVARRFHVPAMGERPAVALRVSAWIGLWVAVCVGLRLYQSFSWAVVITIGVVLALLETFLQQTARPHTAHHP